MGGDNYYSTKTDVDSPYHIYYYGRTHATSLCYRISDGIHYRIGQDGVNNGYLYYYDPMSAPAWVEDLIYHPGRNYYLVNQDLEVNNGTVFIALRHFLNGRLIVLRRNVFSP